MVIVIMALIASVVVTTIRRSNAHPDSAAEEVAKIIASSRKAAVVRGTPVHLQISADGTWALVAEPSGSAIDGGVIQASRKAGQSTILAQSVNLRIDEIGTCIPDNRPNGSQMNAAFDPIGCRTVADTVR